MVAWWRGGAGGGWRGVGREPGPPPRPSPVAVAPRAVEHACVRLSAPRAHRRTVIAIGVAVRILPGSIRVVSLFSNTVR